MRETVKRLGKVYMFSLSVGFNGSLSRDNLWREEVNSRECQTALKDVWGANDVRLVVKTQA